MAVLTEGQTVRSREPTLLVENRFEPGSYRFRLVVIDNERNASEPADLVVRVVERLQPSPPPGPGPVRPVPVAPVGPTPPLAPAGPVVRPRSGAPADSPDPGKPRGTRRRRSRPEH